MEYPHRRYYDLSHPLSTGACKCGVSSRTDNLGPVVSVEVPHLDGNFSTSAANEGLILEGLISLSAGRVEEKRGKLGHLVHSAWILVLLVKILLSLTCNLLDGCLIDRLE